MEKNVVKDIKKIKNGEPVSKDEKSFVARKFGRLLTEVSEWFWHKPVISDNKKIIEKKTFSEKYKLIIRGNTYVKGCGIHCENVHGIHNIICPCCKRFIYHKICLRKQMKRMGKLDLLKEEQWTCPNCILKNSRIKKKKM